MLVKEYMTPNPMTVSEDSSILKTAELMKRKQVRRFPVLRSDELMGIVTDRDLRSAAPSQVISFDAQERELMPELHSLLSNITIREVMSSDVITIRPEQTIVAAAQLMLRHRMSGVPVVDTGGQLLGCAPVRLRRCDTGQDAERLASRIAPGVPADGAIHPDHDRAGRCCGPGCPARRRWTTL